MIIPINLTENSYEIVLLKDSLKNLNQYININRKVLIVTDSGVPEKYAVSVYNQCENAIIVTVKQGESSKSIQQFERILKIMLKNNFTRKDCVIAVGGGVVGDLAGFAASAYMRGLDFYNIPTTLLSQVDSSIGGKVAVNLGEIKNIVGAFYQPKKVIIDPHVLKTLSKRQFLSGLAESIKMAAIADEALFCQFEAEGDKIDIETVIERSLKIKKFFVENDEKENNIRKALNFGHTIGHAIESKADLTALFHGECVALGMLYMCQKDVKTRIRNLLKKVGLPYTHDYDHLYETACHDKKSSGKMITIVYVNKIGEYELRNIPLENLKEYIENF